MLNIKWQNHVNNKDLNVRERQLSLAVKERKLCLARPPILLVQWGFDKVCAMNLRTWPTIKRWDENALPRVWTDPELQVKYVKQDRIAWGKIVTTFYRTQIPPWSIDNKKKHKNMALYKLFIFKTFNALDFAFVCTMINISHKIAQKLLSANIHCPQLLTTSNHFTSTVRFWQDGDICWYHTCYYSWTMTSQTPFFHYSFSV